MLEARTWQELIQLGTMRKGGMLDLFPTATSASCTMQGRVLTVETRLETRMEKRLKTRLKVTKLQQGLLPLEEEEQTPILTSSGEFWSSTFSALLDVAPSTLDTSYAVELADGRISETNVFLGGCTLGLLGHSFDIDLIPVELGSFDVIVGDDCDGG
ncbi:hypothetical protein Tco_1357958, partial [Tanacetum coccineum]